MTFLKRIESICFNSLQTGKRIQSDFAEERKISPNEFLFQFPSNGKADPKDEYGEDLYRDFDVSIPFKRESGSKVDAPHISFNATTAVSIPFKRESGSKEKKRLVKMANGVDKVILFQFPSNGKADPKVNIEHLRLAHAWLFQFPSNGKADPKTFEFARCLGVNNESFNSLQTGKRIQSEQAIEGVNIFAARFNSLQTGKRIQSTACVYEYGNMATPFQFPSNGKADPKQNFQ